MSKTLHLARLRAARGDPGLLGGILKLGGRLLKSTPVVGTAIGVASLGYDAYKAVTSGTKTIPTPAGMPPAAKMAAAKVTSGPGSQFVKDVHSMSWAQIGAKYGMTEAEAKAQWMAMGQPDAQGKVTNPAAMQAGFVGGVAKTLTKIGGTALAAKEVYDVAKGFFPGGGGGMAPAGYHYNKALRRYDVAVAQGHDVSDPRDRPRVVNEVVRNRSMNPLNPRALTRAFARVKGAQRWARRLVRFEKKAVVRRRK